MPSFYLKEFHVGVSVLTDIFRVKLDCFDKRLHSQSC